MNSSIKDIPENSKGSDFSRDVKNSFSMSRDKIEEEEVYDERSEAFNPSTQVDVVR